MTMSYSTLLHILVIYAITLLCSPGLTSSANIGNETDRLALLNFKDSISDDPYGSLKSWNDSIHFCQWYGVACGKRHRRVTGLHLSHKGLVGRISPHIGNLSFLRDIFLGNNSFHHTIPPEIGYLQRLETLILENNTITGEIPPNISSCASLTSLYLGSNQLVGRIPDELGLSPNLQNIALQINNLTGSIPSSLGNLSTLQRLYLPYNLLSGSIPDSLGHLKNLSEISLGVNNFTGVIPPSLFNISGLRLFSVTDNGIRGTLPWDLGITLPNIQHFGVSSNLFTGNIPTTISNASNLVRFVINNNQFSGKVPSLEKLSMLQVFGASNNLVGSGMYSDLNFICSMTNASNLGVIQLHNNNFGGIIPECLGDLSNTLSILTLNKNNLSGSIPVEIGNLVGLEELSMASCNLRGHIPSSIGKLQNLKRLNVAGNRLSGSIPASFGNLSLVTHITLADNILQGRIPASLGKCRNVLFLVLENNNLTGSIPSEITSLSSLFHLNLSRNNLIGELPKQVEKLTNLGALDVSFNMLSGKVPSNLGGCTSLQGLLMQYNLFQGGIPSTLRSLRALQALDLSHNNFSGQIPMFLEGMQLQILNLSYNNFEGKLPTGGVFMNANAISITGNRQLCGGIPEFRLPICRLTERKLSLKLKLTISILSGIIGIMLVLFTLLWLCKKKRKEPASSDSGNSLVRVSYQNLYNATDGFASTNLVGTGSFGSVYKGTLDQGTTFVAVKVMNLQFRGAPKSFVAECTALRNIRHRNLLKVITACSGIDYQGNDFQALVYDFMDNRSLDDWLHPNHGMEGPTNESPRKLNIFQRLNIAIDVVCALDYLHYNCEPAVIHCDLKPSNVLLDGDMIGHLGDFGLARLLPPGAQSYSITQSSSLGIRGTIGYAAPEYAMGSRVSTYGDVYSYGILLLEMFTGKRPSDDMFKEGVNLHSFVKVAIPERVFEILDPVLVLELENSENDTHGSQYQSVIQECLIPIFETGVACSTDLPTHRMKTNDVIARLHSIKQKLVRNQVTGE